MKKKLCSLAICAIMVVAMAVPAWAAACPISNCGRPVSTVYQGMTTTTSTHTFGGFIGIGAQTCTVTDYYRVYAYKCSAGHSLNAYTTFDHSVHSKNCS